MAGISVALRSNDFGKGKSFTMLSFRRPGIEPKRLIFDMEYRDSTYQSPDNQDYPDKGKFAFTQASTEVVEALLTMAPQLRDKTFPFNFVGVDTMTMFQDALIEGVRDEATASSLCRAYGCYNSLAGFLGSRFNVNDTPTYRTILKGILKHWMLSLRKANVDLVITAENRNVWVNFGKKGRNPETNEPWMKIECQASKLWEPVFQMVDCVFVLERLTGNRNDGTAKMSTYPTAMIDTHDPKCSIPGIQPTFVFNNWDVFWAMAEKGKLATVADFAALDIPTPVGYEDEKEMTAADVKSSLVLYAVQKGVLKNESVPEKTRLVAMAKKAGLEVDNVVAQYDAWVKLIQEAADGKEKD